MQSDVSEPIPCSVTAPVQSDGNNYWFGGIGLMLPIHLTKCIAIVPDVKFLVHSRSLFAEGERGLASSK